MAGTADDRPLSAREPLIVHGGRDPPAGVAQTP